MKLIKNVPLFAYILLIYNAVVFYGKVASDLPLVTPLYAFSLPSGTFSFNVGESLLMIGVAALYVEIFKATRTSNASIFDHLFSMLVFVGFLVEFLLVAKAATSYFFILMLMAFLDVVAGFTVTISTSRRDIDLGSGH